MLPAVNLKPKDDDRDRDLLSVHDSSVDTDTALVLLTPSVFAATEFTKVAAQKADEFSNIVMRDNPRLNEFSYFPGSMESATVWKDKCLDADDCILTAEYSDAAYATTLLNTRKIPKFATDGHWEINDEKYHIQASQDILDSPVWESYDETTKHPIESWGYVVVSSGRQSKITDAPVPGHVTLVIENPIMSPGGKVKVGSFGFFPELPDAPFEDVMVDQLKRAVMGDFGQMPMQLWTGDMSWFGALKALKEA